ncbi:MAG: hypothetical protein EOO43_17015 [Flavobacterium sp.]|nr:MAG: hypothetical protein EOO43_17015 [Flavobacterium sp.]
MKRIIMMAAMAIALTACKKDEPQPTCNTIYQKVSNTEGQVFFYFRGAPNVQVTLKEYAAHKVGDEYCY